MKKQPIEKYKDAEKLELKEIKKGFSKTFKKVYCPSCQEELNADNINLNNSVAKCGSCNVIFSIQKEVESVKTKNEIKQEIFRPEGINLFYYKDDLDITIQQHIQGLDAIGLMFMPLFMIFSLVAYFIKGISIFLPAIFILGTLYFIYRLFNHSKNKTYIEINNKNLSIKSRPKNFRKDKNYAVDEIDQLYLKLAVDGSGYHSIYMIINSLNGQKHEKLITVNTLSKAKYLEQEIELYLNIEDRKVLESNV